MPSRANRLQRARGSRGREEKKRGAPARRAAPAVRLERGKRGPPSPRKGASLGRKGSAAPKSSRKPVNRKGSATPKSSRRRDCLEGSATLKSSRSRRPQIKGSATPKRSRSTTLQKVKKKGQRGAREIAKAEVPKSPRKKHPSPKVKKKEQRGAQESAKTRKRSSPKVKKKGRRGAEKSSKSRARSQGQRGVQKPAKSAGTTPSSKPSRRERRPRRPSRTLPTIPKRLQRAARALEKALARKARARGKEAKRIEGQADEERKRARSARVDDRPVVAARFRKDAMKALMAINEEAARRLGLGEGAVRGYRYTDGRIVVRLQVPAKEWNLIGIESAYRGEKRFGEKLFPGKTYMEGNVMFDPRGRLPDGVSEDDTPFPRFRGNLKKTLLRLQMWGSTDPIKALFNLDRRVESLRKRGFVPEMYMIRTAMSFDGTQPFKRIQPPAGGTRINSRRSIVGRRGKKR